MSWEYMSEYKDNKVELLYILSISKIYNRRQNIFKACLFLYQS